MLNPKDVLEFLRVAKPSVYRSWLVNEPLSYKDFVEQLNKDLNKIINRVQDARNSIHDGRADHILEDHISLRIVNQLKAVGYNARHGEHDGGSTDIKVSAISCDGDEYLWIGEAKVYKSGYSNVYEGVKQLITRYTDGRQNGTSGGLFIYFVKDDKIKTLMENWQTFLNGKKEHTNSSNWLLPNAMKHQVCKIDSLAFESIFAHPKSERPYTMRSIPVMLKFDPQDASAVKSDAHAATDNKVKGKGKAKTS